MKVVDTALPLADSRLYGVSTDTIIENQFLGQCNGTAVTTCGHTSTVVADFAMSTTCSSPVELQQIVQVRQIICFAARQ